MQEFQSLFHWLMTCFGFWDVSEISISVVQFPSISHIEIFYDIVIDMNYYIAVGEPSFLYAFFFFFFMSWLMALARIFSTNRNRNIPIDEHLCSGFALRATLQYVVN